MRIGSLFSGYSGLDMAVQAVYGGTVAWVCDNDKAAAKVLAHHHPDAPNLGDITAVDWSTVEPVDVLTAGFPCQPVSNAGKQLGDEDERWLWDEVIRAVRAIRPGLLCLENVRGLSTFRRGALFGRVLGSLAEVGYDAEFVGVRAADVGAAHGRFRWFITAHPVECGQYGREAQQRWSPVEPARAREVVADTTYERHEWNRAPRAGWTGLADRDSGPVALLPTPRGTDATNGGPNQRGSKGDLMLPPAVQPTPAVNDMGAGKTVEQWDTWTDAMKARHGNGNGHGPSLHIEALRMLPTPTVKDGAASGGSSPSNVTLTDAVVRTDMGRTENARHQLLPTPSVADAQGGHLNRSGDRVAHHDRFGDFAPAIERWEHVTAHPAPEPTELAPRGGHRLSCRFDEWLMGLPPGHVTQVPGITHNDALKLCGNGVVPQQAEAALRWLHHVRQDNP